MKKLYLSMSYNMSNKTTAFTKDEREALGLVGKLPPAIETLEQQVSRVWAQVNSYQTTLHKNIYLMELHNSNEVLFYAVLKKYLTELLPIVYTPTVGLAVQKFSDEFRFPPRALYLTLDDQDNLIEILRNYSSDEIKIIVVTDSEGILGIGDQGIGGVCIPVAKLALYTLFAGFDPKCGLPIVLDVGTNNEELLHNPFYLGKRQKRTTGKAYDEFIAKFVAAVKQVLPNVLLHWEDLGRDNADKNLQLYRDKICSFNDDIQGTGVVTLAAILSATKALKQKIGEQRIIIFGAGTAGVGIANQICAAIVKEGVDEATARKCFWLIDKQGLLTKAIKDATTGQSQYLRENSEIEKWQVTDRNNISLLEVVKNVHPTILIGCSGRGGAFTEEVIKAMAQQAEHPIIMPLSNPTEKCEAIPENIVNWTNGKALIATGSPFPNIAQCNNALAYPGLGVGAVLVKSKMISDNMLWQACVALAENSPILKNDNAPLLPPVSQAAQINRKITLAVAKAAIDENLAQLIPKDLEKYLDEIFWEAVY
jgi:malate dehydrogenase (oxaloacetate-decarboxylating)